MRCVCCGEIVPEGRLVCPSCENKAFSLNETNPVSRIKKLVLLIQDIDEYNSEKLYPILAPKNTMSYIDMMLLIQQALLYAEELEKTLEENQYESVSNLS